MSQLYVNIVDSDLEYNVIRFVMENCLASRDQKIIL